MADRDLDQLLALLLDQLPLGLIVTDANGDIIYVNHTAEQIRKVAKDSLIGHNVIYCHPPNTRENVTRAINHMVSHPGTTYTRMVEDRGNNKTYSNTYSNIIDHQNTVKGMVVVTQDITEKRKLELEQARMAQIQRETIDNLKLQYHNLLVATMQSISSILEAKDTYTQNHSENVCRLSKKMYEHVHGITADYYEICTAAMLHDIGKICIPDSILGKPAKLTAAEYETIKIHSTIAENILKPMDMGKTSSIIRSHHEKFDGQGYPDGLSGNDIPLGARIIAIADAFDAMRSDRPYRKAMPFDACIEELISQSGKQFDPFWVDVFCELAKTGSL